MAALKVLANEHKLIIEMLRVVNEQLIHAGETGKLDIKSLNAAIDFMAIFSGEFHHGKEEKMLFREFEKRNPLDEHVQLLRGLYEDHLKIRDYTDKLGEVRDEYLYSSESSLVELLQVLKEASDFYRNHVHKEDNIFYPVLLDYYSGRELDAIAERMREYDSTFIMNRYARIVDRLLHGDETE